MFPRIHQHDDVCLVCDKWIEDATDKLRNWKECPHCPQAYHTHCIPSKRRWSHRQLTCTEYFEGNYTSNGEEYQCCDPSREAQLLCNPKEKPIKIGYYRTINGRKTEPIAKHERDPNKRYFRSKTYSSLYWKNVSFGSGDCIDVRMVDGTHRIARIKEIFLDEEDAIPHVVITWVMTEIRALPKLLDKYKARTLPFELPDASLMYKAMHVYFDLNDEDTVSIETVESKVLVIETFEEFRDTIRSNWKSDEYSKIVYGKWCYDPKFGDHPFKLLKEALALKQKQKSKEKKIAFLTVSNLRRHDDEYGQRKKNNFDMYGQQKHRANNKKMNKMNKRPGPPKLEKMNNRMNTDQKTKPQLPNYRIPKRRNRILQKNKEKKRKRETLNESQTNNKKRKIEDSSSIPEDSSNYSDAEIETENTNNANSVAQTAALPRKQRKTKTPKKLILEKNKKKYDQNEMNQMNDICQRLNMGKGPKISSNLYHFKSHLEVYKVIDYLFKVNDGDGFEQYINGKKQDWCRDIKYAMYTKGGIVPLATMRANIANRFRELKPNYKSAAN